MSHSPKGNLQSASGPTDVHGASIPMDVDGLDFDLCGELTVLGEQVSS